jgi:hypothetical protein
MKICTKGKIIKCRFKDQNATLENIQQSLETYLEMKR